MTLPDPPSWNLSRIIKRRSKLRSLFDCISSGDDLTAEHCWSCCVALKSKDVYQNALETWKQLVSFVDRHGISVVPRVVTWLAGNWDILDSHPLPVADDASATWMIVELLSYEPRTLCGKRIVVFSSYVWTSLYAGLTVPIAFVGSSLEAYSSSFAFSRRNPYDGNFSSFIGLFACVHVVPGRHDVWRCNAIHSNRDVIAKNRGVLRRRHRFIRRTPDYLACPMQYDHDCSQCPESSNTCVASYHRIIPA